MDYIEAHYLMKIKDVPASFIVVGMWYQAMEVLSHTSVSIACLSLASLRLSLVAARFTSSAAC
jgi:hypothetical protein